MVKTPVRTSVSKGKAIDPDVLQGGEIVNGRFASVSYVRVSTQKQTNEGKSGLDRQDDGYIDWQASHPNYDDLGLTFKDLGVSGRGKNSEQGALALFIKKAKRGEIPIGTCLVCSDMSRLTRQEPYKGIKLIQEIWDLGLTLAFTEGRWRGDVLTGKERGVFGQIEAALEAASWEWEKLQKRVKGHHNKTLKMMLDGDLSFFKPRKKGKKTNYNFWLDFDENTNTFFEIKDKADFVRRIFNMAETMGFKKIAYTLKEEGIKTPIEWGKGKYITSRVIEESILRSRAVLGERNHTGVIFKDTYPPIISPEQFDLVQAAIAKRRLNPTIASPKNKVVNLFQGVSYCSHCCGRMVVVTKKRLISEKKWQANSTKIEAEYQTIQCESAREKLNDCKATNAAPYIQEHNDLDNELKILNKIGAFRWADFFTDEKHEKELKVVTAQRMKRLEERNQIEQKLDNLKSSRQRCWEDNEPVPDELKELIKFKQDEYDQAHIGYERSKLDIQNLKRKKTGQQLEVDIHKRVKTFIEKDRLIPSKRSEFNMFLKESGIAIDIAVFKKQHASTVQEENYKFNIGIGMYDFITGKYRGLDETEEAAVLFGIDLKHLREGAARREESLRKQSLEVGRDIRFPIEKPELTEDEIEQKKNYKFVRPRPVLPPDWTGAPDDYLDYWINVEKEAGRVNKSGIPTRWIWKSPEKITAA